MSDYTTFLANNPNYYSNTSLVDGNKFYVVQDSNEKGDTSIFNYDGGSLFGTFDLDDGIFSGASAEEDESFINNESIWKNQPGLESNTTKENTAEENPNPPPTTTFSVQGVSKPKPGTLWGEKAFSQRSKTLIYPEDHSSENFDFIKITPIEYVPALKTDNVKGRGNSSAINPGSEEWFGFRNIESRYLRVKQVGSTMFLPMTPDISENNAVDWGGDRMNAIQAAAGKIAFDTIGQAGSGDVRGAVSNFLSDTGDAAQAFIKNPQIGNFIKAYFAGQAVNTNLLGRAGIVINPNLEVLFNGPALRTFAYNFRFTPRTESEATTVRTIIKVLKKTMAPKRRGKVFLTPPAVYRLKYIFNSEDDDHPFLNKIKPCALTGFNVQYAPDGNYMTYDDGSMTSYNVQMNFSELEPIYNDDIDDVDDRTTGF